MTQIRLVDADWVAAHLEDSRLVLLDTRSQESYTEGHLPGARRADAARFSFPLTDAISVAERLAAIGQQFAALGVNRDSSVLVLGERIDTAVAKLAWALCFAGHDKVLVLEEPLSSLSHLFTTAASLPAALGDFSPIARHDLFADAASVRSGIADQAVQLLDARDLEDYEGKTGSGQRIGRIPGARHWDASREINAQGHLLPGAALRTLLAQQGLDADRDLVVYCGSGGRASRTWLALQSAGVRKARVYPGSWNEWASRPELPIQSGPAAS